MKRGDLARKFARIALGGAMLIIGVRLFGRCDKVPGVCWVATKFVHVWYFPFVPMGSWAVVEQSGSDWRGVPIGFSVKSILVAWVRATLFLVLAGGAVLTLAMSQDPRPDWTPGAMAMTLGATGALASYRAAWITHASARRTASLLRRFGLALADACPACGLETPHPVLCCSQCGEPMPLVRVGEAAPLQVAPVSGGVGVPSRRGG